MIAICPNPFRDKKCELSIKAAQLLSEHGYEVCISPVFCEDGEAILPSELPIVTLDSVLDDCSLIIAVGGDGTILRISRLIHNCRVPILGINLGTKGFMASLEPDELELLIKAAEGSYTISKRMNIELDLYRGNRIIYSDTALNDTVVHGYGDCIKLTAFCDGAMITSFSGDGIILSTPTGSTGYSMSAGGPIVEPEAENIIISPICAHMMSARSYVLGPDREIEIHVEKLHGRRAYLSVDGNSVLDLSNHDRLIIKRSEDYTYMVNMGQRSFYDIAFEKLR